MMCRDCLNVASTPFQRCFRFLHVGLKERKITSAIKKIDPLSTCDADAPERYESSNDGRSKVTLTSEEDV